MIPDVCSNRTQFVEPPKKKIKRDHPSAKTKRIISNQDQGPLKKKRKVFQLTNQQIEKLDAKEIESYLKDDAVSDSEKINILENSPRVNYAQSLLTCIFHCETEKPALYCLKNVDYNSDRSLDNKFPLVFLFNVLCRQTKPNFDFNALYTALKKRGAEESDSVTSIFCEACRQGLKDLIISCIKFGGNIFKKNLFQEAPYTLAFEHLSSLDFKDILDAAIQSHLKRRSLRLFLEKGSINWILEFGDTWAARVALIFATEDKKIRCCNPSERIRLLRILSQNDFNRLYLCLYKNLPRTSRLIAELNAMNLAKPDREEVLGVVRGWAENNDALHIMPLFKGIGVSSNRFLFWAEYFSTECKNMQFCKLYSCENLMVHLVPRAVGCLNNSLSHLFTGISKEEKLQVLSLFMCIGAGLPKISNVNEKLLDFCFESLIDSFSDFKFDDSLRFVQNGIYSKFDGFDKSEIRSESFVNHPNDTLIRIGLKVAEDDSHEGFVHFISMLRPKDLVSLISFSHQDPDFLYFLISYYCMFDRLELRSGGHCQNTWEPLLQGMLKSLGSFKTEPHLPILKDLKTKLDLQKCDQSSSRTTKMLPASWLETLKEQGWIKVKRFGRTELYKNSNNNSYMAIKFQKSEEDPNDLYREYLITKCFHERGEELGLKSQFPKPQDFIEFYGDMPKGFFDDWDTKLVFEKNPYHRHFAYIYTFPNDSYFHYLDESASEEAFNKGREAVLHDLFLLINDNVIMTALAGLFHNVNQNRRYLPFPGLIFNDWRKGRSSGRIDKWEIATKWSNERESGLADAQEFEYLQDMLSTKKWFKEIFHNKKDRPVPETLLLANFLAEYLLVDELILAKRSKQMDLLDWQDLEKTQNLAKKLADGALIAFNSSTLFSKRVCKRLLNNLGTRFDVYAKQLAFWLQNNDKGYVPHIKKGKIPKSIYPEGKVIVGPTNKMDNWQRGLGFSEDKKNADIGSYNGVNPIKEGEIHRVFMVITLLAFRKAKEFEKESYHSGLRAMLAGDYQDARIAFEEALRFNPYSKENWGLLAKVHNHLGNDTLAEVCQKQKAALTIQHAYDQYKKE